MNTEKNTPSDLELQILSVLWKRGPSTVHEVLDAMPDGKKRAYTTILSVMQVMEKKKFLKHKRDKLTHIYQPKVERQEILAPLMKGLIQKVFGGRPSSVLQCLLKENEIDKTEISEIQKLLKDHKGKN